MKINGLNDAPQMDRPAAGKPGTNAPGAAAAPASANVSLSDLATRLQSLEAEMTASEPFDAAKVEEIKQAMREGQFKVNAGVVADRLIESMKELLGRKIQ